MAEATLSGAIHPILENDYASEWMGIEVLKLDDGHATIRMTLRQEMLNGFGMAHGGMIFAFGDTAFALACNPAGQQPGAPGSDTAGSDTAGSDTAGSDTAGSDTAGSAPGAGTGSDTITVASGVDINFLKPAFTGQVITAVANRRAHAGRSGLYDVQIYAADPHAAAGSSTSTDAGTDETPGELIAEFRGRSRTISKK